VLCVIFCDVCYSVFCVIVVPLPPGINPLAVINNIYNIINPSRCMETEGSLPHLQEPAICHYPEYSPSRLLNVVSTNAQLCLVLSH
jgi:hypothetical protein